ncbi:hypothetical protein I6N95_01205 [Vagococcus sp. BWB3-3]|uniref:Uncharacterized protein n=1 Tax=Vagococcus allomyrinae TaxID=2794353 RepID=A0A940STF1_9ENTE|nr:hypothetical protein [Vagococcus allomyrinae]MBP1039614.1 hypothetical protein [Vagococcus allomyrinae]
MKTRYFLRMLTSTFFLVGILGGQLLTTETVFANGPILDPLNPQMEIEPIDSLVKPSEEAAEPSLSQTEKATQKEVVVEEQPPSKPTVVAAPSLLAVEGLPPKNDNHQQLASEWERLGLTSPKLLPINRRLNQKKFVTNDFFHQKLTIPPEISGDEQEIVSELSRICYTLSGKLIFGRHGHSNY